MEFLKFFIFGIAGVSLIIWVALIKKKDFLTILQMR